MQTRGKTPTAAPVRETRRITKDIAWFLSGGLLVCFGGAGSWGETYQGRRQQTTERITIRSGEWKIEVAQISAKVGKRRRLVAKTGSMLLMIPIGSTLVVDTEYYQRHAVQRFDIVVLRRSRSQYPDRPAVTDELVARIIGLGGETVTLQKNALFIGGRRLLEPMQTLPCTDEPEPCGTIGPVQIPAHEYFLLADNRSESEDSRLWQPPTIPGSDIVGKVVQIIPPRK
jgi:signal peptidase I